jgi:uncharacterized protein YdhG (YjbR/CyaY superfamily)
MRILPFKTVDEYIAHFPKDVQPLLKAMRKMILDTAPHAEEMIRYGMPTYKFQGTVVHFAAFKKHLGFFPGSGPIISFADRLKPYKLGKGTIQFPLDTPLPLALVRDIIVDKIQKN